MASWLEQVDRPLRLRLPLILNLILPLSLSLSLDPERQTDVETYAVVGCSDHCVCDSAGSASRLGHQTNALPLHRGAKRRWSRRAC